MIFGIVEGLAANTRRWDQREFEGKIENNQFYNLSKCYMFFSQSIRTFHVEKLMDQNV